MNLSNPKGLTNHAMLCRLNGKGDLQHFWGNEVPSSMEATRARIRHGSHSGSENKQPFVIAVSTDENLEHPAFAVIEPVRSFDDVSMIDWGTRRLAEGAEVFSDGLHCFRRFAEQGHAHTVLVTGGGRAATQAKGARWANTVLGNVKRAISGRYHSIRQSKYARRYLAEAAYRFNRRFRLAQMLPRLLRAMVLCAPCAEPTLRAASNYIG